MKDGSNSEIQRLLAASDAADTATGQNFDKDLVKSSVMAGLFQRIIEPTRIGRFSLIKRIGTGGMGEVYAAYDEQLDRKVAIKLVRPDASRDASQRLVREAQVLARLSHPNVVQVYEAGTVGDRVFVAMEFIRGQTLRQWLGQQNERPESQRIRIMLDIFLSAGRGLQAAHAAGLVHRDFKPDNVLIGDDGRVCVADFGLARVESDNPATDAARHTTSGEPPRNDAIALPTDTITRSGMQMGTPSYMSPEQWQGEPSDSRSDQFSFCVALYEALYRVHPFGVRNRTLLCKRVLAGQHEKPPRATPVPARIWTILQRGLAVAPADRYPDMGELLDELAADPRRQWRRRMAAAVLLVAGALAGGGIALHGASDSRADPCALAGETVATLWNPGVAAQMRDAFAATNVAYAVASWNIIQPHITEYAATLQDARQATCEATNVRHEQSRELFDLQTLCLDRREHHLRALLGELRRADASVVEKSAEAVAALPRIAACADRENLKLGPEPPAENEKEQVRVIQDALAQAHVQQLLGHRARAQELARAQLLASERLAYQPVRAEALHQVGFISFRDGGPKDVIEHAETVMREALDVAESNRHDELAHQILLDLVLLGRRYHTDSTLIHEWARRAVATSDRPSDPVQRRQQKSAALCLRGAIYAKEGKLDLAEKHQREALVLISGQPGVSPLARARCLQELANTVLARGDVSGARSRFEEALALQKQELGDGHPGIARLSFDMALALKKAGDFDRARELLDHASAIWISITGPMSLDLADTHLVLAKLELEIGNLDMADEHARLGRAMYDKLEPEDSQWRVYPEATVAEVAFRGEHFDQALAAYERALAAARRAPSNAATLLQQAQYQNNIGETLVMLGRPDEALQRIADAEALLARIDHDIPPAYEAGLLKSRGLAYLARGEARTAARFLEQALRRMSEASGKTAYPLEYAEIERALARAWRAAGRGDTKRAHEHRRQ